MGWEKLLHAATQHADCKSTSIGEEVDVASQSTEIHLSQKKVSQAVMKREGRVWNRLRLGSCSSTGYFRELRAGKLAHGDFIKEDCATSYATQGKRMQ